MRDRNNSLKDRVDGLVDEHKTYREEAEKLTGLEEAMKKDWLGESSGNGCLSEFCSRVCGDLWACGWVWWDPLCSTTGDWRVCGCGVVRVGCEGLRL